MFLRMEHQAGIERPRTVYPVRRQAILLAGLWVFYALIWVDILGRSRNRAGFIFGFAVAAVTLVGVARAAAAAVIVEGDQVRIRNPFRTVILDRAAISRVRLGRFKLLGCVLVFDLRDGRRVPAFAIQGITGQPKRKWSIEAQRLADLLDQDLADAPRGIAAG